MLDCSAVSVHIVTPDRGRARAGVDVRDRPLLHHDLHDLHRLRERGGGHRHGEDLHTLHDDRYGVCCVAMQWFLYWPCACVWQCRVFCTRPSSVTWPPSSTTWRWPRPSTTRCWTGCGSSWSSTRSRATSPRGSWTTWSPSGPTPRSVWTVD